MTNLQQAAKQALEALDEIHPGNMTPMAEQAWKKAITALRAALAEPERSNQCGETCERAKLCAICASGIAEPEQEPVGRVTGWHGGHCVIELLNPALVLPDNTALYTAPTPRKPLTDEEIWKCLPPDPDELAFARAIERAHGIGEQT